MKCSLTWVWFIYQRWYCDNVRQHDGQSCVSSSNQSDVSGAGGGKTLHHLNTVGIYEMANSGLKYVYPHCFVVDDVSGSGEGNGMVGCIGDFTLLSSI